VAAGNFSLHHRCVQTGSGAHPASYCSHDDRKPVLFTVCCLQTRHDLVDSPRLYSSDVGCQLEKVPARGLLQLRRRISPVTVLESEVATRGYLRTDMKQFSPLELLGATNTLGSCWDAASHSCITSVGWLCCPSQGILGGYGHPRNRDILGTACSGPRYDRTAVSCSTV